MVHAFNKVTLAQVHVRALGCSPVSVIRPILHTVVHLNIALTRRTKGRKLGTLQKLSFGNREALYSLWAKTYLTLVKSDPY
jgi:hypothetical protein